MAIQVRVTPEDLASLRAGMPRLDLDGTMRSRRQLGKVLRVHGPFEPNAGLIADGLVRLVDKTILEYQACYGRLCSFYDAGYLSEYHRAQDHFESCVQALHKAICYTDRLRGMGYRSPDGEPLVHKPRDFEVLRPASTKQVRDFRDNLEHLDADIIKGELSVSSDVGPSLRFDHAVLKRTALKYSDIVLWSMQLHTIAATLSVVKATVTDPPPRPESA